MSDSTDDRPTTIDTEQIKQIYDYTKYHIGMYSTLLTLLIAIHTYSKGSGIGEQYRSVIFTVIILLLIGGIAGALAASRIVYGPWKDEEFRIDESEFWKNRVLIPKQRNWNWKWTRWWSWAGICLTVEHYAFWFALFYALIGLRA